MNLEEWLEGRTAIDGRKSLGLFVHIDRDDFTTEAWQDWSGSFLSGEWGEPSLWLVEVLEDGTAVTYCVDE